MDIIAGFSSTWAAPRSCEERLIPFASVTIATRYFLFVCLFVCSILIEEIGAGHFQSLDNMGYLNSVLSCSSQIHAAEEAPVSGGGLR